VNHPVSGATLSFSLAEQMEIVRRELSELPARAGRTIVKEGALTVTLVGVKPGGELRPHKADGPITVQVLEGEIDVQSGGVSRTLPTGTLVAFNSGIVHGVTSPRGGIFLLTVVNGTERNAP
jgi:quercetin dioxygenase-like cupin family protein